MTFTGLDAPDGPKRISCAEPRAMVPVSMRANGVQKTLPSICLYEVILCFAVRGSCDQIDAASSSLSIRTVTLILVVMAKSVGRGRDVLFARAATV